MTATVLALDDRCKRYPMAPVKPSDFAFHGSGTVNAGCLLTDPTLSIYCLDLSERLAFFVRTPPDIDLGQAPFLYVTQCQEATELVCLPFAELYKLSASTTVPSERLILVYSTGRCGSTLVSHALAAAEDVVSLSEPDVYSQLP